MLLSGGSCSRRNIVAQLYPYLSCFALVSACGAPPVCAPGSCPTSRVCGLSGECEALHRGSSARFARAVRVFANDWTTTRDDHRSLRSGDQDELLVGGEANATAFLAFELPADRRIVRATLTLYPAADAAHAPNQEIRIFPVSGFNGAILDARTPPRRIGPRRAARVSGGATRPIRIDATAAVAEERSSPASPRRQVHLGLESNGEERWPRRLGSPAAIDPARRPHLDLRLL